MSAYEAEGCRFTPSLRHTKVDKNGTGSSVVDACNKRAVPGRITRYYVKDICYVAVKALQMKIKTVYI